MLQAMKVLYVKPSPPPILIRVRPKCLPQHHFIQIPLVCVPPLIQVAVFQNHIVQLAILKFLERIREVKGVSTD